VNRVYRLMDSVLRLFTVDSWWWCPEELIGAWLTGAVEPESSPLKRQKEEGTAVILTGCTDRR
jgi:hypothetical protein